VASALAAPVVLLGRVVCCEPRGGDALGAIEAGAVAVEAGKIAFVGRRSSLPERFASLPAASVPLITPGLVDAHTHAAWMGSRHDEYVAKLRGDGYEAIAARGGGIVASMRAIEAADVAAIVATLSARLRRMASLGVTTVEVKSGYGLRPELERRQLEAIAIVARDASLPRVVATFLALHALPPESRGDDALRSTFVERAVSLVSEVARDGLAAFVDAYVDRNAFTVDEARRAGRVAREAGLGVRLHVGQFADVGGAELAAELGARSADHLEVVGPRGIEAMAKAGVAATLLPVAALVLQQRPPDVVALRAAGIPLVVASDANPGTAPTESLPLAMMLAARTYGLSAEETLLGATATAARTLSLDAGRLVAGAPADLVAWDLPHEDALLQPWGASRALLVLREGRCIHRELALLASAE
jgi:imidazolonepropionase